MRIRGSFFERRGRFSAFAPLVLWIAVILILGSGQGSMTQTSRFIKPLIEFFFPHADPDTFRIVHAAIRKLAHFFEYAILGLLAARAFASASAGVLSRYWHLAAFLLVVLIAAVDETIQSFDPSRTGAFTDFLIDVSGGLAAVLLVLFTARARR